MDTVRRDDFPVLGRTLDDKPLLYLDSAAISLKPHSVIQAETFYATNIAANVHRGKHALSEEASAAYEGARKKVARFINADPASVVFVRNTTEALNLVAFGLSLDKEDTVLVAGCEHHSNLLPWMRRARVQMFDHDPKAPIPVPTFEEHLRRHRPKVVSLGHASNVTGVIHPAKELGRIAKRYGAITVLDAAQAAPHLRLDTEELGFDFIAFSGHKMLGPAGTGVLWGRRDAFDELEPLMLGGGCVDRVTREGFTFKRAPYKFEAGTPNISGVIGLGAAIDYLERVGMEEVLAHDRVLADALERALQGLSNARILMATGPERLAIASIVPLSKELHPDQVALLLSDGHQIMARSGFHCAHPCFDYLGISRGAVRVSAYLYNTIEEMDRFGEVIRHIFEAVHRAPGGGS